MRAAAGKPGRIAVRGSWAAWVFLIWICPFPNVYFYELHFRFVISKRGISIKLQEAFLIWIWSIPNHVFLRIFMRQFCICIHHNSGFCYRSSERMSHFGMISFTFNFWVVVIELHHYRRKKRTNCGHFSQRPTSIHHQMGVIEKKQFLVKMIRIWCWWIRSDPILCVGVSRCWGY